MNTPVAADPARLFATAWDVYGKILTDNYMYHRELTRDAARWLAQHAAPGPVAVLELGCGDASQTPAVLAGLQVARYHGCDLAAPALAAAAERLAGLGAAVTLQCADMLTGMAGLTGPWDVIYSGFALHHLDAGGKARFFALAHDLLRPGGALVVVDVMRHDHEDRTAYLAGYLDAARSRWTGLSPAEFAALETHVRDCDWPETATVHRELAGRAGFAGGEQFGAWGWHRGLAFTRPGALR